MTPLIILAVWLLLNVAVAALLLLADRRREKWTELNDRRRFDQAMERVARG